jgi:hypothetical protein
VEFDIVERGKEKIEKKGKRAKWMMRGTEELFQAVS